jgi:hypothetical protein
MNCRPSFVTFFHWPGFPLRRHENARVSLVRPERLELPAYWFEASRSIQLSYGRTG